MNTTAILAGSALFLFALIVLLLLRLRRLGQEGCRTRQLLDAERRDVREKVDKVLRIADDLDRRLHGVADVLRGKKRAPTLEEVQARRHR